MHLTYPATLYIIMQRISVNIKINAIIYANANRARYESAHMFIMS